MTWTEAEGRVEYLQEAARYLATVPSEVEREIFGRTRGQGGRGLGTGHAGRSSAGRLTSRYRAGAGREEGQALSAGAGGPARPAAAALQQ